MFEPELAFMGLELTYMGLLYLLCPKHPEDGQGPKPLEKVQSG